jgi:hypothetical protein
MACGPQTRARAGCGRTRARVRLGNDPWWGMTDGPHLSASAGGGGERLAQLGGPAGPEGLLGRVLGGLTRARQAAVAGLRRWAGKGRRAEFGKGKGRV